MLWCRYYPDERRCINVYTENEEDRIPDVSYCRGQCGIDFMTGGKAPHPVGRKDDKDKPDWSLLPMDVIQAAVEVLTDGAKKYSPNGWQHLKDLNDRYYSALIRTVVASRTGEKNDPESGRSHLAHALCNIIFLLWKEMQDADDGV